MIVKVEKVDENAIIPKYQTNGSSGFDLHSTQNMTIIAHETILIKTGLKFQIPTGFEGQIRARSGLALKHNICLGNGIGTIDSDYRGEVGVLIHNMHNYIPFYIRKGMRIAQMIISPVVRVELAHMNVDETIRNEGGFGHTGH